MSRWVKIAHDRPLVGEVDAEARIASVPRVRTTKGMYFADLVSRVPAREAAAIRPLLLAPPRHDTYQPFLDYPLADVLRWMHAVARHEHPRVSLLEGLRLLGRGTVGVFLASATGRVIKPLLSGPCESLLKMPAMWSKTDPSNQTAAFREGDAAVRFEIRGFEGWIDCGVVGTLEQVVLNHRHLPTVELLQYDASHAELIVRVRPESPLVL